MKWIYAISICFVLACASEDKGPLLAEAYGAKLYANEVLGLVGENASVEDSVFIVEEYINIWVRRQIILNESKTILTEAEMNKTKELESYKNDLISYETLNKLVAQKMDTIVPHLEIEEYYEEHQEEFELSQNIIKVSFFKLPASLEDLDEYWRRFKRNEENVYDALEEISNESDNNFYRNNNSWIYFDDILKEIPINTYNQEHFLNNNKLIRIPDGNEVYFVKIHDFKTTSNISPLSIEKQSIKHIILRKREKKIMEQVETELMQKAYNNKQVIRF